MGKLFDVLGLGAVAVDELIYVDQYPLPDQKAHVLHAERQCGGLTATALVAGARFGARCAYAGVLGNDELSLFARETLLREKVNLDYLLEEKSARPVHSFILVDQAKSTRNIFADARGAIGASAQWPAPDLIRQTQVLFVDHFGLTGMLRAATVAREAGIPIVGDLERNSGPEFERLLGMVDHLIVSLHFAMTLTGAADPATIVGQLWSSDRNTVVVTGGEKGCWYRSANDPGTVHHHRAFPVKAVDTTGCGDVFHGVYAAGLAENRPVDDRIRLASAAAALKATHPGGQAGIPPREHLERFIAARP
jgi:sugar/nucleoside kinase (ribokinase family)